MVSNIFQRTGAPRTGVMGAAGEMSALAGGQFGAGSEWGRAADAGGPSRSLSLFTPSDEPSVVKRPHSTSVKRPPTTQDRRDCTNSSVLMRAIGRASQLTPLLAGK